MNIYHNIQDFKKIKNAVTTVGVFDGVHLGHQKIINLLLKKAKDTETESVIITFDPHPRLYFDPTASHNLKLITDIQEKIELFEALGVHNLLIIPFDDHIANLSSEEFIDQVVIDAIGTQTLLLGHDHRFGKNREGSFDYLKQNEAKFGIQVFEISRMDIDEAAVSSTRIRTHLNNGEVHAAALLLGRNYKAQGIVVEGRKLGRTIGYPTANVHIENEYKLLPKMGVYAVEVWVKGKQYGGMLNIGFNPTISASVHRSIEVYIFDFEDDIYGNSIDIAFLERLRDEQKFDGLDALKAQLAKDAIEAREICFKNKLFY